MKDFRDTYIILDAVTTPSQQVVFEIEYLETSVEVFDELTDLQWPMIVPKGDRVDCQTSLLPLSALGGNRPCGYIVPTPR